MAAIKITITKKHLDKALKQCPPDSVEGCLIATAVAEFLEVDPMAQNFTTGFTAFGIPGKCLRLTGHSKLRGLFDARTEESIRELRGMLPAVVEATEV